MKRIHAAVVAVMVGTSTVTGGFALARVTSGVDPVTGVKAEQSALPVTEDLAARAQRIEAANRKLDAAEAAKPPKLPPVPARKSGSTVAASGGGSSTAGGGGGSGGRRSAGGSGSGMTPTAGRGTSPGGPSEAIRPHQPSPNGTQGGGHHDDDESEPEHRGDDDGREVENEVEHEDEPEQEHEDDD